MTLLRGITAFISCGAVALAFVNEGRYRLPFRPAVFQHRGLTIIDSTDVRDRRTVKKLLHLPQYSEGVYQVYYIGPIQDTVCLGVAPIAARHDDAHIDAIRNWGNPDSSQLSVEVDTTVRLLAEQSYRRWMPLSRPSDFQVGYEIEDSVRYLPAYPLVVRNLGDSTVYFNTQNLLRQVRREARTPAGKWQLIEMPLSANFCGMMARQIYLEPRQMLVAKVIQYAGDRKALCRLRFQYGRGRAFYSNAFYDYVSDSIPTALKKRLHPLLEPGPEADR